MKRSLVALLAGGALLVAGTPALAQTAKPALGPYGYGAVKLGMSTAKARATGKIVFKMGPGVGSCSGWDLKGHPTGRGLVGVYISKRVGVAVIMAPKGVRTPQGIGLGSRMKRVKSVYPGLRKSPSGFSYVSVPGNPKAYYAFIHSGGKVRQLILALDKQDCVN